MGLAAACFRRSRQHDYYGRSRQHDYYRPHSGHDDHGYASPAPPRRRPASTYFFADWIKLSCLGGGSNNRKRKAVARDDQDSRRQRQLAQPEVVGRKLKKKQVHARGDHDNNYITLQEFLIRSPSRLPSAATNNNKVYPNSQLGSPFGGAGSFSLEMLLDIGEADSVGVEHNHTTNTCTDDGYNNNNNNMIREGDAGSASAGSNNFSDDVTDEGNSINRKRRVSFKLPEEGDIFMYDPSDDDEEQEDSLMIGVYYF